MDISASYSKNNTIRNVDICTILVNLLDNAIEACEKIDNSEDRYIKLSISSLGGMVVIKVENSCSQFVFDDGQIVELKTTKNDSKSHGYGLKIVKAIANKYNGELEIRHDSKKFIAVAMLMYDN